MDKNNNQKEYKLRQWFFSGLILALMHLLDGVLVFFGLRDSKRYWGIVYDSISKQPLDPVIVKLMYVDGHEVESRVTDMEGHYGFLARPGKFKIFARKTNYEFPSQIVTGDKDGIFENLYHGEFFALSGDNEVVAPNIPMDPVNSDWNQEAKKKVVNTYPYLKYFVNKMGIILFWSGLIFVLLNLFIIYPKVPNYIFAVSGAYVILAIMAAILPEPRLWGKLKIKNLDIPAEKIFLELRNEKFFEIALDKTQVREDGKFLLRAKPGRCFLLASELVNGKPIRLLARKLIRVGHSGVINRNFTLH